MKVLRLQAKGLHSYLDFDVHFNDELTFLTGINGSGKTSAVRALVALLTPSLRDLARLEFKGLVLTVDVEGDELELKATRSELELVLSVTGENAELRIPVLMRESYEPTGRWTERETEYYREQTAMHATHPVLARVVKIPTPMFLDLERRAQEGVRRRLGVPSTARIGHLQRPFLSGSLADSLVDAQNLAEERYRRLQARQKELADKLKHDLILTAFKGSVDLQRFSLPRAADIKKSEANEALVQRSLKALGLPEDELAQVVGAFFGRVRGAMKPFLSSSAETPSPEQTTVWFALQPQVLQVQQVVALVEEYGKAVEKIMEPITKFLALVNRFLKDGGKELRFSTTGDLEVAIPPGMPRSISALSSGERQVIVILTHLAFNGAAREANVLIIDEPELSLHLHWQEHFVEALQAASPHVQLILATHSPAIILERTDACVDMSEARLR